MGRLIGIARRSGPRQPMEVLSSGIISPETGLSGDHKGRKFKNRAITLMAKEAWEVALSELSSPDGAMNLPWTTRRANLLVEGMELPKARGARVQVGPVLLEVTYETYPCSRMEKACAGLMKALAPDWRGGLTCRVLEGGPIAVGNEIAVLFHPGNEVPVRLP